MTNNKQQTAVELFAIALYEKGLLIGNGDLMQDILEEFKAMEKEQIVNTWSQAMSLDYEIGLLDASYILCQIHNAEQYYNETYGNEQQ